MTQKLSGKKADPHKAARTAAEKVARAALPGWQIKRGTEASLYAADSTSETKTVLDVVSGDIAQLQAELGLSSAVAASADHTDSEEQTYAVRLTRPVSDTSPIRETTVLVSGNKIVAMQG